MPNISLRNLSRQLNTAVRFQLNSDWGLQYYGQNDSVFLSNDNGKTALEVCMAPIKGPIVSCEGASSIFTFLTDFSTQGSVYVDGNEVVIEGYYITEALERASRSLYMQYVYDPATDSEYIRVSNNNNSPTRVSIRFDESKDYYAFKESINMDSNNSIYTDDENLTVSVCLEKPLRYEASYNGTGFIGSELFFMIEVFQTPDDVFDASDFEIQLEGGAELLSYEPYPSERYLNIELSFQKDDPGEVVLTVFYKGVLQKTYYIVVAEPPSIVLTSAESLSKILVGSPFITLTSTTTTGVSQSSFRYEFKDNNPLSGVTGQVVAEVSSHRLVARSAGTVSVRSYYYDYQFNDYVYSNWLEVSTYDIDMTAFNTTLVLDRGASKTLELPLIGWDGDDFPTDLTFTYSTTNTTGSYVTSLEFLRDKILVHVQSTTSASLSPILFRGVLYLKGNTYRQYSQNIISQSFNGDVVSYVLGGEGNQRRIVGKVFAHEKLDSITATQLVRYSWEPSGVGTTSTVTLDENNEFDITVDLSTWPSNSTTHGLKFTVNSSIYRQFSIAVNVLEVLEPVEFTATGGLSLDVSNLTSSENLNRPLPVVSGNVRFYETRHGVGKIDLDNYAGAVSVKLYAEAQRSSGSQSISNYVVQDVDSALGSSITKVSSFGNGSRLKYAPSFLNCKALVSIPTSIPSGWTSLNNTFKGATSLVGTEAKSWDVRTVSDFTGTFNGCIAFSADLSKWCTSSASSYGNFGYETRLTAAMFPVWGTCPLG